MGCFRIVHKLLVKMMYGIVKIKGEADHGKDL